MNDGAVTIVYDGDGRRVGKTVGGVTTRYLVDDRNPTHLPQVVEEIVNGMRSAWQRIALGGGAGAVLGAGSGAGAPATICRRCKHSIPKGLDNDRDRRTAKSHRQSASGLTQPCQS